MIEKIISGGQTGVDQAALQAAKILNIPRGGWCPKAGLDETGKSVHYEHPLIPTLQTDPNIRTQLNIRDSDATLIFVPEWPLSDKIKDGTLLTLSTLHQTQKPYYIINLSISFSPYPIKFWIKKHGIQILNIAGPRESNAKGIYQKTLDCLLAIFNRF